MDAPAKIPTHTTLTGITNWLDWNNDLRAFTGSYGVWHYIKPTDRLDWMPEPDASASDKLLRQHDRQQDQKRAVHKWILDHISPMLAVAVKSLVNASASDYYDCLFSKLQITPDRLRADMQRKYDNAMQAMSTRPSN
ncbi:MAG: hypothetical protein SEPTF4163_006125 [Sporothrix epigloea]